MFKILLFILSLSSIVYGRDIDTALIYYAKDGNLKEVKTLIKKGVAIDAKDSDNITALYYASSNGHTDVVELLIKNSANINAKTNYGLPIIIEASSKGHSDIVKLLIDSGVDVDIRDTGENATALINAVRMNHLETAKILIDNGANVNAIHGDHWTSLTYASSNKNIAMIKLLEKNGAGKEDLSDKAYLFKAVAKGGLAKVKSLINAGMDVNTRDNYGMIALVNASRNGHTEIVKFLIDNGADKSYFEDALIATSNIDIVKLLIDYGVDINASNRYYNNALTLAAVYGYSDIVKLLIENGANINYAGEEGSTALMNASSQNHIEIVKLLLDNGADVNAINLSGDTALVLASQFGYKNIIKLLKKAEKK